LIGLVVFEKIFEKRLRDELFIPVLIETQSVTQIEDRKP